MRPTTLMTLLITTATSLYLATMKKATTDFQHHSIDQTGDKTISCVAPDGITKLTSHEETGQFLDQNPTLNVSTSQFCWLDLVIGFKNPEWETVHIQDLRQRHSQTRSKSPTASSSQSAAEDQTLSLADVDNDISHEQISNTNIPPHWDNQPTPPSHDSRPQRLENTLKPSMNLNRDMSLSEADNWLKGFTVWFDWNAPILNSKGPLTKGILLENFLDDRLLSKLQTDDSITMDTPVLGHGGIVDKLRSYYTDDCPLIC
jgi:hypothetical protein